ncbi:NADPH--cytochrome P450 reductase, putative [Trypanosoma equiperdum]|uniref:NADPH--cytochrome P450 reductase, putative n=1 Tax=Trypanosoma equiperdum TaxID=5694 RepID=A0A1G4IHH1_TRYEQ|nr:NADPH--cytochrome P450 reductase, putative [Trypanosoma equiperdum]
MFRRFCTASGILAGTCLVAFAVRVWVTRRGCLPNERSLSAKYANMLQNGQASKGCQTYQDEAILVIYGSVSGNAEMYAKTLVTNLRERGADIALIDPSAWPYLAQHTPQQPLFPASKGTQMPVVVFVVSTTGEGEVPDNFFSLFIQMKAVVRRGLEEGAEPFKDVFYAVFALGESSYKYFCRAGVDVDGLLQKGGGTELVPIGIGDARDPLRDDLFDAWEETLTKKLEETCGMKLEALSDKPPQPQLLFRFIPDKPADTLPFAPPPSLLEPSGQYPGQFVLEAKTRRTSEREDGSYVLHLVLGFGGHTVKYQAGDHLGIYPANPPDVVEAYRQVLNIPLTDWTKPVELCSPVNARARASLRNTLPARVTLRTVFERYLDLCGKPRKSMLRLLARYCSEIEEKTAMIDFLRGGHSLNAVAEFGTSTPSYRRGHYTVLDCLKMFCSWRGRLPVGHFVEAMPRMQPRFYSIASDMLTHPTTVEAFIRIIPDGVNSLFLHHLSVGAKVTAFVRKSTFHLPQKCSGRPVVMIGPGTGIASMIGFCYRREAMLKKQAAVEHGPMVLFFGNRNRSSEYFVEREVRQWCPHGEGKLPSAGVRCDSVLTLVDAAFSRDQPEKYYVTHLLEKHQDYLLKLLTSRVGGGCLIYISGDASRVSRSVDKAILKLLEYGGFAEEAAVEFLARMEREGRYLKDVY